MASGLLYERIGGHAFLIMAALCLLALPMCAALRLSACGGVREDYQAIMSAALIGTQSAQSSHLLRNLLSPIF